MRLVKANKGEKFNTFVETLKMNGLLLWEPSDFFIHNTRSINRYVGKRMEPANWKQVVPFH